jgi:hypothetical protein
MILPKFFVVFQKKVCVLLQLLYEGRQKRKQERRNKESIVPCYNVTESGTVATKKKAHLSSYLIS